jgi:hypothetical protein
MIIHDTGRSDIARLVVGGPGHPGRVSPADKTELARRAAVSGGAHSRGALPHWLGETHAPRRVVNWSAAREVLP